MSRRGANWQPGGGMSSGTINSASDPWAASTSTPTAIEPLRFGLKHEPPSLVMEYKKGRKLRHYAIHFKEGDLKKDAKVLAKKLMERHGDYLNPNYVTTNQLESLIERLQQGPPPPSKPSTTTGPSRNNYSTTSTTSSNKGLGSGERLPIRNNNTSTTTTTTAKFGDLNRVSDRELAAAKNVMNKDFEKNQLRPDDPDYEWDKQVDFRAEEPSDWDDDEDDF